MVLFFFQKEPLTSCITIFFTLGKLNIGERYTRNIVVLRHKKFSAQLIGPVYLLDQLFFIGVNNLLYLVY